MGMVTGILQGLGSSASGYAAAYQLEQDKRIAGYQADYEVQAAAVEEEDYREQATEILGSAQAVSGVSGFDVSVGSAADAVESIIRRREVDAAVIRHGGKVGRWASIVERDSLKYGAKAARVGAHFAGGAAGASAGGAARSWWQGRRQQQGTQAGSYYNMPSGKGGGNSTAWYDYQ